MSGLTRCCTSSTLVGNPLYDSAEHKAACREFARQIADGQGWCAELVCLMPSRIIPTGTPRSQWDAAHDRANGGYLGPAHAKCNRAEGGREKHRRAKTRRRWAL